MASFKMTGTLMVIGETVQVSDKFAKREFVINDGASEYPQDIMFQLVQDKVGQDIEVSFNMRGRKWTSPQGEDKYFNSLDAWRVDAVANEESTQEKVADKQEVEDDMPF